MLTRKQLLGAGAAAGSAALVSACGGGGDSGAHRPSRDQVQALDLKLIGSALDLEHTLVAAYAAGAALLNGSAQRAAREIVSQEQEHARRLTALVRQLGAQPNPPKTKAEYARSFPRLTERADALRFAIDLENSAVRYYLESLPHLSTPELRRVAASIATSEAGHAALLRGELGRVQVPDAFVTGRSEPG